MIISGPFSIKNVDISDILSPKFCCINPNPTRTSPPIALKLNALVNPDINCGAYFPTVPRMPLSPPPIFSPI